MDTKVLIHYVARMLNARIRPTEKEIHDLGIWICPDNKDANILIVNLGDGSKLKITKQTAYRWIWRERKFIKSGKSTDWPQYSNPTE